MMLLVSPEAIAAVMALDPVPHSLAELEVRVREGLPISALLAAVELATGKAEERRALLAHIASPGIYRRRRERLTREESEKTERLARVLATAYHIWGSLLDMRQFLATPHVLLNGSMPLEVGLGELGARRVEELLWSLFYGLPA